MVLVRFCLVTAVYHATDGGHLGTVKFLVAQKADVNLSSPGGWRPIHVACSKKRLEVLRFLVSIEGPLELDTANTESKGYAPIHFLVMSPKPSCEAITMLLAAGCNINVQSASGNTAIHLCAMMGRMDAARLLLQHPRIDLKIQNGQKRLAVEMAVSHGHEDVARMIADKMGLKALPKVRRTEVRIKTVDTPKAPPKPSDA